jgi:hypothetical protein
VAQPGETGGRIWATEAQAFARVRTGRLVEVRIARLRSLADIESLDVAVHAAVRTAGPGAVVCADHRLASPLLSRELADAWSRGMRQANRSVGRSAILLNPANTTFNLQIERIVECAGHEGRRVFGDREGLLRWLDGVLTEAERERLRAFLLDGPG